MTAADTSRSSIAALNRFIAGKILPRIPEPGNWPTAIKGLILYRRDWDYLSENCFYPPAITAVIQGQRNSFLGDREYHYEEGDCLVHSVEVPSVNYFTKASSEKPFLSVSLQVDRYLAARFARDIAPGCAIAPETETSENISVADIDIDGLMEHVKAPDFPTGGFIYGMQGVREAYETGRGRIVMRARAEIEPGESHDKIVVTEIPYGVNKAELIKQIADLVNDKKIDGISNVNDESDREGMRIVVDVKRDANANVVLNKLFKMTPLQTSFSVNCIALVKGRPRLLSLKDCISNFVEHRHDVVIRRTRYDLRKAEERAHILEGLIIASDNID